MMKVKVKGWSKKIYVPKNSLRTERDKDLIKYVFPNKTKLTKHRCKLICFYNTKYYKVVKCIFESFYLDAQSIYFDTESCKCILRLSKKGNK